MIGRVTSTGAGAHPPELEAGIVGTAEVEAVGRSGRDAAVQLLVRTIALRAVTIVGTIVLARVLGPADYGVFAVVLFLVSIIEPIGGLGLGSALVQQRDRPTEIELATVFTAQQLLWLLMLVVVWLLAPLVNLLAVDLPVDAEWMLRVIALALFLSQLQSLPTAMMTRVLRIGRLATIEVVQQVVYMSVALVLAVRGAGPWSFVLALFAQYAVGSTLVFLAWGRLPPIGLDGAVLRRLLGFGVPFQLTGIVILLREAVVPLFGGLGGGVVAIGQLLFGQRLGRLVSGFDEIAARVAFPAFSRLQADRARLARALRVTVEMTALVLAPIMCWTIATAPTLIPIVFSDRWIPAVPVFQLTAVAGLLGTPALLARSLAFAAGRARAVLVWSAIAGIVTLILFPPLILGLGLTGGGIGFIVYSAISLAGFAFAARDVAPFPWSGLARIYALGSVAGVAAAAALGIDNGLAGLVACGVVFGLVYGVTALMFERQQVRGSWRLLRSGLVT